MNGREYMLKESVTTLKGVGKKTAEDLKLMDILTIEDVLMHFPIRYQVSEVKDIQTIRHEEDATIIGVIAVEPTVAFYGRKKSTMRFSIEVDGVIVQAVMFNRAFAKKHLQIGKTVTLTGKWDAHRLKITVQHYQMGQPTSEMTIQPYYSIKVSITNAKFKTYVTQAIKLALKEVVEILPTAYLHNYKLPERMIAIDALHHPKKRHILKHAKRRFVYEE